MRQILHKSIFVLLFLVVQNPCLAEKKSNSKKKSEMGSQQAVDDKAQNFVTYKDLSEKADKISDKIDHHLFWILSAIGACSVLAAGVIAKIAKDEANKTRIELRQANRSLLLIMNEMNIVVKSDPAGRRIRETWDEISKGA